MLHGDPDGKGEGFARGRWTRLRGCGGRQASEGELGGFQVVDEGLAVQQGERRPVEGNGVGLEVGALGVVQREVGEAEVVGEAAGEAGEADLAASEGRDFPFGERAAGVRVERAERCCDGHDRKNEDGGGGAEEVAGEPVHPVSTWSEHLADTDI